MSTIKATADVDSIVYAVVRRGGCDMATLRLMGFLASVLVFIPSARAQQLLPPAWRELQPGSLVKVLHADTATAIGRYRSIGERDLVLTGPCSLAPSLSCGTSNITFNLRSIRAAMVRRHQLGRGVLRGALLGAGIGAALGMLTGQTEENSGLEMFLAFTGTFGAIGGAAGGLVGALVPSWKPLPPVPVRMGESP